MAIYTSNVNRVTGLSGVDTESMIDQMMKAESAKYNRLEKEKTKVTWKQEAFRQLITSMQNFQNKWFSTTSLSSNIGYDAFWNNYKTSIIDKNTGKESNAITINSTTNSGKYDINIIEKAETETITGGNISTSITTDKNAADIEKVINDYGDISLNFNLDGVSKEINITKDELNGKSIDQVLNEKLEKAFGTTNDKNPKVTVEKGSDGKLSFKPAGEGHSLTITDGSSRTNGVSFEVADVLKEGSSSFEITIDGYTAKVTFDSEKDKTAEQKLAKIKEALKKAENSAGETKDISSYVSLSKGQGDSLKITNTSKDKELNLSVKSDSGQQTEKLNPTGSASLIGLTNNTNSVKLSSKLTNVFGDGIFKGGDEITLNFGGKEVTVNKDDTIQSFINKVNSSGANVEMEFNEVTNRFTLKSTQSGSNGNIQIDDTTTKDFLLNNMKIDVENKEKNEKYTQGKDAVFEIDGIRTTRPSNEVSMNGISFTINTTGNVTLEASNNVDETVKKIKEFVEDYNKLIEEFNNAVMESRPKSGQYGYYEPLTDDEKEAMSEDEIKKYEEQAKKGLLYRDEHLSRFLSSLRDNVYKSVDIGGKSISLYEIGITTTKDFNDGGKLEIDEEKLKKALQERGDEVKQLFTSKDGIAAQIKKDIDDAIGSNGYLRNKAGIKGTISATNNDLTKELEDITKRLAAERERLYNKEMYYFNMFAKMESAMNQQNNQMSVLLSMSGQ